MKIFLRSKCMQFFNSIRMVWDGTRNFLKFWHFFNKCLIRWFLIKKACIRKIKDKYHTKNYPLPLTKTLILFSFSPLFSSLNKGENLLILKIRLIHYLENGRKLLPCPNLEIFSISPKLSKQFSYHPPSSPLTPTPIRNGRPPT